MLEAVLWSIRLGRPFARKRKLIWHVWIESEGRPLFFYCPNDRPDRIFEKVYGDIAAEFHRKMVGYMQMFLWRDRLWRL